MKTILWLILGLSFATFAPAQSRGPIVTLSAVDDTAAEGSDDDDDDDDVDNTALFVVRRSGGVQNSLRVFYFVAGNARNGLDYELVERSVVIPAGSSEATIEIIPLDDELDEPNEFVLLHLRPAPPHARKYRIGAARRAVVEIVDNDEPLDAPLPRIWLSIKNRAPGAELLPTFEAPAQITILVTDSSPFTIDTVEVFANDQSLVVFENPNPGERFVNPRNPLDAARFKFAWSDVSAGTYILTARGVTTDGRLVFANPITIRVEP